MSVRETVGLVLVGALAGFALCMAIFGTQVASDQTQTIVAGCWLTLLLFANWLMFADDVRDFMRRKLH